MNKGELGYMDSHKKKQLKWTIIYFTMIAITVLVVLIKYKTTKQPFIVVPALLALPASKALVGLLVVHKYTSCKKDLGNKISSLLSSTKDYVLLYDLAISSRETVMYVPCLIFKQGQVYVLFTHITAKASTSTVKEYLEQILAVLGYDYKVEIFAETDKFLKAIETGIGSIEDLEVIEDAENIKTENIEIENIEIENIEIENIEIENIEIENIEENEMNEQTNKVQSKEKEYDEIKRRILSTAI